MPRRNRIGGFYVTRRKDGTFKKWVSVGRSIAADRRQRGKPVKPGYGHRGDVQNDMSNPLEDLFNNL